LRVLREFSGTIALKVPYEVASNATSDFRHVLVSVGSYFDELEFDLVPR
jgi:hypothetical protein